MVVHSPSRRNHRFDDRLNAYLAALPDDALLRVSTLEDLIEFNLIEAAHGFEVATGHRIPPDI